MAKSYHVITGKPGCVSGASVCAIYAGDCGPSPVSPLSSNILTYIADALGELVAQPQLPVGSKYFVYMKD